MKCLFLTVTTVLIFYYSNAQLKTTKICATFSVDVLSGRVNNAVEANSTQGQVKQNLPCFTSEEPENKSSACGGGIFYNDKGIYFYTGRDYIEIRENFKGKLSIPLMGSARNSLFKTLGNPKIKDVSWDAYTTRYGILILYYNKANKVNKIQLSTMTAESINLCQ